VTAGARKGYPKWRLPGRARMVEEEEKNPPSALPPRWQRQRDSAPRLSWQQPLRYMGAALPVAARDPAPGAKGCAKNFLASILA